MEDKVLVVYYSRTGNTRRAAEIIAARLGAETEEIIDHRSRDGPIGWLLAGRDGGRKNLTEIEPPRQDPSGYDLVVVGTPVWNDNVSAPVRTYLNGYAAKCGRLAVFITHDAPKTGALADVNSLVQGEPVASVELRRNDEGNAGKLEAFINQLKDL